jgi:MFS family permease
MGLGIGFCYITPIKYGWEYFPENKGFVSGVIMSAFGMGSFIFSFVALAIVNPD